MLQEGRARAQAGRWDRFTILCPPGAAALGEVTPTCAQTLRPRPAQHLAPT